MSIVSLSSGHFAGFTLLDSGLLSRLCVAVRLCALPLSSYVSAHHLPGLYSGLHISAYKLYQSICMQLPLHAVSQYPDVVFLGKG